MYWFRILNTALFTKRFFGKQNAYNGGFIDEFIQQQNTDFPGGLNDSVLKKIKQYYCLGVPITCEVYSLIHGRSMTVKERGLATQMGIITPVIDDFTDDKTLSETALDQLTQFPEAYSYNSPETEIVAKTLAGLKKELAYPEDFFKELRETIDAQHWSIKQMHLSTSTDELLKISLHKGGKSHVLFHYLLDEKPSKALDECLYSMGGVLQICNDIFDVYKDYQAGIRTYANTCTDYMAFEKWYIDACRDFCRKARALNYSRKNTERYILFFSAILGRGVVALKQLQAVQAGYPGQALPINKIERKALICDMEKPANLLKTLRYTEDIYRY
ncbi:class 1 isoprenoid biosynthesis enzyme [Polluticaenibacter yanchengensis]|uniref:Class 1 isoprenoid biosynthesis enzyme n=1 Tax=Polluticaenibacter yanchengensis TaxID=3014562 RepID=A0ABT4UMC6_9BACT|nr:class 1 isoprenoid biosynthesis enzyme [Chitinophagaceae bacterium LY-5]